MQQLNLLLVFLHINLDINLKHFDLVSDSVPFMFQSKAINKT